MFTDHEYSTTFAIKHLEMYEFPRIFKYPESLDFIEIEILKNSLY